MTELGWLVVLQGDTGGLDGALDTATRCGSLPDAEFEAKDLQLHGFTTKIYKVVEVAHYNGKERA